MDAGLSHNTARSWLSLLLGINEPEQLRHHPLRGAIFESWVVSEVYKAQLHQGITPALFHFRDAKGLEVDLVQETGSTLRLIEAKSGATVSGDFLAPLTKLATAVGESKPHWQVERYLVHGGERRATQGGVELLPWQALDQAPWAARDSAGS